MSVDSDTYSVGLIMQPNDQRNAIFSRVGMRRLTGKQNTPGPTGLSNHHNLPQTPRTSRFPRRKHTRQQIFLSDIRASRVPKCRVTLEISQHNPTPHHRHTFLDLVECGMAKQTGEEHLRKEELIR